MEIGMLWYDGDPSRCMDEKVERAAAYYRDKYGRSPNLCLIHPKMADPLSMAVNARIEIQLSYSVLLDHFWMGMRPDEALEKKAVSGDPAAS